ncbi:MAG: ABC transporter substrate-binding protein [Actinomycetota bacterium]
MRGYTKALVATVVLVMVAAACSSKSSGGDTNTSAAPGASGGTFSFVNAEPNTLIPQNDYESAGGQVFEAIFTRLVTYDFATGAPLMAQAESVTPSDDGLTYTIVIKDGWTFHNGEPVTAQSYVDAWNRTAYGPNGYILNFFFDHIEGYDAMNVDKPTTKELSGVAVQNDTTFTVTLTAPFSQFVITLGYDAFDPLPQAFYDNPDAYNEKPIGDGPYMMDGAWKHDETINLMRYPDYAGTPGYADNIKLPIYTGDAAWADFQAGNLDITLVGSDHIEEAQTAYPDGLKAQAGSTYLYLGLPLYDERFQNKELRQALSMAIDRQAVITAILVAEQPAGDVMPPSIAGYVAGACHYCTLDVAGAQQKLADAGGWTGELTMNIYADDQVLEQAMEAVVNQWKQNLGIDVKLNATSYPQYDAAITAHKMTGPWWAGWGMDYPSPQDYLTPLYGANGGYNTSGYQSSSFDDLMTQGDQAPTLDVSIPFYRQGADMILEDMPVIPWGYIGFNTVNQPTVTNVLKNGPIDSLALELVQVVQP